jgi:hypothetical protein
VYAAPTLLFSVPVSSYFDRGPARLRNTSELGLLSVDRRLCTSNGRHPKTSDKPEKERRHVVVIKIQKVPIPGERASLSNG